MYLSKLYAKNFRQFNDFCVEFNSGLNLLVGENNAGKSTIIDAIRLALDTTSAEWINLKDTDFLAGKNELNIKLEFNNLTIRESAVFIEHLSNEKVTDAPDRSVLYINLTAKLTKNFSKKSKFIKTEIRSGKCSDGPILERDVRDYLATTYLKPLRDAEAELSAGRSSRLSQILGSKSSLSGDAESVRRLIELLSQANNEIKDDVAIQTAQSNIATLLNSLTFRSDVDDRPNGSTHDRPNGATF